MKNLIILSYNSIIKKYLENTIKSVIGNELNIYFYSLEEISNINFTADLVVITGEFLLERAKKIFQDTKIIIARRVLTGYNLEKVFLIPKNSNVLLVSNPLEMSFELADALDDFGITHINYLYYDKSKKTDWNKVDYIITPGMGHLCSNSSIKMINLGFRTLSVTTFSKILNFFNFDMEYLEKFEKNHIRLHIETCRKVTNSLELSEKYQKNQRLILNNSSEGILELDDNNNILLTNPMLNTIFGSTSELMKNSFFLNLLDKFKEKNSDEQCSIITTYKETELYCTKDTIMFKNKKLHLYTFKKVALIQDLENDLRKNYKNKGFNAKYNFKDIWGKNTRIENMKIKAYNFSQNNHTLLITGESGTGKEILAQSIHNASNRAQNCFVAVNITSIPENLIESELFGYKEGAFTGAKKTGKLGFFEIAHKGTLFIDEIGDASKRLQAILLRVLEEKQITPVGSESYIPINVRVIAATNKNLKKMVEKGTFRKDLYYRLNVLSIKTIPLRLMKNEIIAFVNKYLRVNYNTSKIFNGTIKNILSSYDWPGNFRELKNAVDYIYYSSNTRTNIIKQDLPYDIINNEANNFSLDSIEFNELQENPILFEILSIFYQAIPNSIGRNKILKKLYNYNMNITEYELKKYLDKLEKLKLISIGNTKQGTSITDKGKLYLNYPNMNI